VSIICTDASWAVASASMIRAHQQAGAAPRPKMRFRLRPLVDNDPSDETAELPKGS
jgi:hypothetical protein